MRPREPFYTVVIGGELVLIYQVKKFSDRSFFDFIFFSTFVWFPFLRPALMTRSREKQLR